MKPFIEQAQSYASYHQKPITRYTHFAGVPLIMFSLMIFLGFVKIIVPGVLATDLACLATLVLLGYYFFLEWLLALALTPILFLMLWLSTWITVLGPTKGALWVFLITFILGWGLQLAGHFMEGKKPAFMDNFCQALIAPLALIAELLFMLGLLNSLKEKIHGSKVTSIPS